MSKREQVRAFLTKLFADQGDAEPLADDESLVVSGRLSSLDVVNTLLFLEETFGFDMDPSEFDPNMFDSVNSIIAMVGET